MYIKEYLEKNDLTHEQFCKECHISKGYLRSILYRKTRPSAKICALISIATQGQVTKEEILRECEKNYCPCCGQVVDHRSQ